MCAINGAITGGIKGALIGAAMGFVSGALGGAAGFGLSQEFGKLAAFAILGAVGLGLSVATGGWQGIITFGVALLGAYVGGRVMGVNIFDFRHQKTGENLGDRQVKVKLLACPLIYHGTHRSLKPARHGRVIKYYL